MRATKKYVEQRFDHFNELMFGGRLPRVPIELSDAATFMGKCIYLKQVHKDGRTTYSEFRLSFNTRVDLSERVLEDIIIHEMIHYSILYNGFNDSSSHGDIFKAITASINKTYGRNVTLKHKATAEEHIELRGSQARWVVIAVARMRSGKVAIKVLPRQAHTILDYNKHMSAVGDVRELSYYLHNDPFFGLYPKSGSYKLYSVEEEELRTHLKGAHKLRLEGNRVIQE